PVIARRFVVHADDAVRSAWNISSVNGVGAGIKRKLLRSKTTSLNKADAGALNVIEVADAGRMRSYIRIVHFRINAAHTVALVAVPHVADWVARRMVDLALEQA